MRDRESRRRDRIPRIGDANAERAARDLKRWRQDLGDFLADFAWCHFVTLTVDRPCSPERLRRLVLHESHRRAAKMAQWSVPYFCAVEPGADAAWSHLHALVAATGHLTTAQLEGAWTRGHTRIRVYDPRRAGAHYVVKEIGGRCELYDLSRKWPPILAAA